MRRPGRTFRGLRDALLHGKETANHCLGERRCGLGVVRWKVAVIASRRPRSWLRCRIRRGAAIAPKSDEPHTEGPPPPGPSGMTLPVTEGDCRAAAGSK